jgi:hypothetical protein
MKAEIENLWDTRREVLVGNGDIITTISDLRKCENVLVGDKSRYGYEVLIGDQVCIISAKTVQHPSGGGTTVVLEVE